MVNFESKAGEIKGAEIDLSKIYASKQNALAGINNVKITEKNASWKSDNLTYKILDDNQTVMISNGGVPIGFTTVQALADKANSGTTNPHEMVSVPDQAIDNADYTRNVEEIEETPVETPATTGTEEQTVETTYDESPADEVKEEHNTPLNSGEEAPTGDQTIDAKVEESAAEEIKQEETPTETPTSEQVIEAEVDEAAAAEIAAETQQPPEPPVNIDSLELESAVDQNTGSAFNGSGLDPSSALYKKLAGNTANLDLMINWLKNNGFSDLQICGIVGNAAHESGLQLDAQNPTSSAHGLFQWLSNRYPSSWDFNTQMSHMVSEYGTRTDRHGVTVAEHYASVTSTDDATRTWAVYFEGSEEALSIKQKYAADVWDYIHGN